MGKNEMETAVQAEKVLMVIGLRHANKCKRCGSTLDTSNEKYSGEYKEFCNVDCMDADREMSRRHGDWYVAVWADESGLLTIHLQHASGGPIRIAEPGGFEPSGTQLSFGFRSDPGTTKRGIENK